MPKPSRNNTPPHLQLYLYRWPNGDLSVVMARTEDDAIDILDEIGNGDYCPPPSLLKNFSVNFKLTDIGEYEMESFGEQTVHEIDSKAYPVLAQAKRRIDFADDGNFSESTRSRLEKAVRAERERVQPRVPDPPGDTVGRVLHDMDFPRAVIERAREEAMDGIAAEMELAIEKGADKRGNQN